MRAFFSDLHRYDISREFSVVAADLGLRLTTFYELNPYSRPFWAAPARIVVDKRSAILGLPDEEIIAVHGHHGELCKFASAEDPKFRPVWIRIENFSQQAEERLRARKGGLKGMCLYTLTQRTSPILTIQDRCRWATGRPDPK